MREDDDRQGTPSRAGVAQRPCERWWLIGTRQWWNDGGSKGWRMPSVPVMTVCANYTRNSNLTLARDFPAYEVDTQAADDTAHRYATPLFTSLRRLPPSATRHAARASEPKSHPQAGRVASASGRIASKATPSNPGMAYLSPGGSAMRRDEHPWRVVSGLDPPGLPFESMRGYLGRKSRPGSRTYTRVYGYAPSMRREGPGRSHTTAAIPNFRCP